MNDFLRCLLIDLKKKQHGEEVPHYYINDFDLAAFKSKLNSIEFLEAIRKEVLKNSDKNRYYMTFSIVRVNERFRIQYLGNYKYETLAEVYCEEDEFNDLFIKYTREIMIKLKELGFKRNYKAYGYKDRQDLTLCIKFWIDESKKYL